MHQAAHHKAAEVALVRFFSFDIVYVLPLTLLSIRKRNSKPFKLPRYVPNELLLLAVVIQNCNDPPQELQHSLDNLSTYVEDILSTNKYTLSFFSFLFVSYRNGTGLR